MQAYLLRPGKVYQEQFCPFHIPFPEEDFEKWMSMVPDVPAVAAEELSAMGLPGWEWAKRWQEVTTELGYTWPREWAVKK